MLFMTKVTILEKLEFMHHNAALAVTGAVRRYSEKLYQELTLLRVSSE